MVVNCTVSIDVEIPDDTDPNELEDVITDKLDSVIVCAYEMDDYATR